MFSTRTATRIATATLAAALSLGALLGVGSVGVNQQAEDAKTEEVAATWSFTGPVGGKGWSGTNGATWS